MGRGTNTIKTYSCRRYKKAECTAPCQWTVGKGCDEQTATRTNQTANQPNTPQIPFTRRLDSVSIMSSPQGAKGTQVSDASFQYKLRWKVAELFMKTRIARRPNTETDTDYFFIYTGHQANVPEIQATVHVLTSLNTHTHTRVSLLCIDPEAESHAQANPFVRVRGFLTKQINRNKSTKSTKSKSTKTSTHTKQVVLYLSTFRPTDHTFSMKMALEIRECVPDAHVVAMIPWSFEGPVLETGDMQTYLNTGTVTVAPGIRNNDRILPKARPLYAFSPSHCYLLWSARPGKGLRVVPVSVSAETQTQTGTHTWEDANRWMLQRHTQPLWSLSLTSDERTGTYTYMAQCWFCKQVPKKLGCVAKWETAVTTLIDTEKRNPVV
jgi:hypothetical protein